MASHAGKGKKFCKNCKAVCGAAVKICQECKSEFNGKKKNSYVVENQDAPNTKRVIVIPQGYENYRILSSTYTPAGYCPIKLKSSPSETDVIDWADRVRVHFLEGHNNWVLNSALCYYLRYDYDIFGKPYKELCKIINKIPDLEQKNKTLAGAL